MPLPPGPTKPRLLLALLLAVHCLHRCCSAAQATALTQFDAIQGRLCIRDQHVIDVDGDGMSRLVCAHQCTELPDCHGFTWAPGAGACCRLFVFDRCSRPVAECSCNRTGQVFVRRRPGLPAGRLCGTAYADEDARCGLRYRVATGAGTWPAFQALATVEPGQLGGFADALDSVELAWVLGVSVRRSSSFFLGGAQLLGSPEPAGGFRWLGCDRPINASLFWPGEPDNRDGTENYIGVYFGGTASLGLLDVPVDPYGTALFMCVSPFD